ncbi:MAG: hypothetical protein ABIG11_06560 [bacterium]
MRIEIAALPLEIELPREAFSTLLKKRYGNFVSGQKPLFCLTAAFKKRRQSPFTPSVRTHGVLLEIRRGDFWCIIDTASGQGRLEISPSVQTFDSFLRTIYSWLLPHHGGVLLHAGAVARKGRGYVFFGKSGAGKSTLCRLSADKGKILTDELVPIRLARMSGLCKAMVYGSPFWGELRNKGRNFSVPLKGLFSLKKSGLNVIKKHEKAGMLRKMLKTVMCFSRSSEDAALILGIASRLCGLARCGELEFSKKGGFWKIIAV